MTAILDSDNSLNSKVKFEGVKIAFIDLEYGMDENWQNLSLKSSEHENTNDINFRFGKIPHSKIYVFV